MNKRSNEKSKCSVKAKIIKSAAVILFIILSISAIYVVDTSTNSIMNYRADNSAIGVYMVQEGNIEVELAGEKYIFDVGLVIDAINNMTVKIRQLIWGILQ